MDGNPREHKRLGEKIVLFISALILFVDLVLFMHYPVGDFVAGDIQGRLVPVTIIFMIPVVIGLILWVIWLTGKDRTKG